MVPFALFELDRAGGLAPAARAVVEEFLAGRRLPIEPAADTDGGGGPNPPATLVVDASGSMRYRGRQPLAKFEYARQVAAALAYLMLVRHTAAGLVVHDTRVRQFVRPHAGVKHLLGLFRGLERVQPGRDTALARVWHDLAAKAPRSPGRVVLLSDCFDLPRHLARALLDLRDRGLDVVLFHVLAPEEIDFPFDRPTRFRSLERPGEEVRVDARRVRAEYRESFDAHCEELRRAARDLRVDYHLLRTDGPVERALGLYLRTGQAGGAAGEPRP